MSQDWHRHRPKDVSSVVWREAIRLAKNVIKDEIRQPRKGGPGSKVSYYEAKDIRRAAIYLLGCAEGRELIEQAKANLKTKAA
jgi:hypothetical protein